MNFRNWLSQITLQEMGNLAAFSTDHIKLEPQANGSYTYEFDKNINGLIQHFEVTFAPTPVHFGTKIPNSWSIVFTGPHEHTQTNKAGFFASSIYTQILLTIKKFLETVPVNALAFTGFSYNMDIVYHRFYKQYLQKDFIRVNSAEYIRKTYMKDVLYNHPDKEYLYKQIISNEREWRNVLKDRKNIKKDSRQKFFFGRQNLNSFIYILGENDKKIPVWLYKMEKDFFLGFVLSTLNIFSVRINPEDIDTTPVSSEHIHEFLQRTLWPGNYEIQGFLKEPNGQPLVQLMKSYGYNPRTF